MPRKIQKQIFILVASGFEETDVSTITRTLRRSGLPVAVVGLTAGPIQGNYGLSLEPDLLLSETSDTLPQAVVLPGGVQSARQLCTDPRVHALLHQVLAQGGHIMALDAAYTVLRSAGMLDQTSEPSVGAPILSWREERGPSERVIVDGAVIFGRDSGAAHEAALTLMALIESQRRSALR